MSISYSNPLYGTRLPNNLIFRFPILREPLPFFPARETTYVCLSPHLGHAVQKGFYFEGGDVKGDCLEDWDVFWSPLHAELRRRASLTTCATSSLSKPNKDERQ
jgi:hypothetical protein